MRRFIGYVLIPVLGAATLGLAPATDGIAATSRPSVRLTDLYDPLQHGGSVSVTYSGLAPGASYTASSTHGAFDFGWTEHTFDFTASTAGTFVGNVSMPSNDPADQLELDLTETGQSTVLASLTIQISPPSLATYHPCPDSSVMLSGTGFLDGSYQFHSTAGTMDSTPVNSYRGSLTTRTLSLPDSVAPFTLTATKDGDSSPAISQQYTFRTGSLTLTSTSTWQGTLTGGCFAPGEQVDLTGPADLQLPSSLTANGSGLLSGTVSYRPDLQTSKDAAVSATGHTSGQTGTSNTIQIASNTLRSGQTLASPDQLASAEPGYTFADYRCDAPLLQAYPPGQPTVWSALPYNSNTLSGCFGYLRPDGNFILYSAANKILWATNTSGDGNRLVLQNTGVLQVVSADDKVLWSSATVPSYAYLTGSRSGSAVYVNGLVKQRAPTAELVRSPNRTVYLQRYLSGGWQNVLSRITGSQGQFTVGFVQAKVYNYRLLVPPATNMPMALSNTVQK